MSNEINNEAEIGQRLVGKIILAQLGNSFDTHWCPEAECLVVDSREHFGSHQYTAVAKEQNGDLLVLFDVSLRKDETGYCTKACKLKDKHFAAMAGGVSAAEQVEKAVLQHIGNIETKLISFDWKGREVA